MTYTLEQLSSDIKVALAADPGPGGKGGRVIRLRR